jgi:hypothetical protein
LKCIFYEKILYFPIVSVPNGKAWPPHKELSPVLGFAKEKRSHDGLSFGSCPLQRWLGLKAHQDQENREEANVRGQVSK